MDIGPGDFLECLRGGKHPMGGNPVHTGAVYVVRGLIDGVNHATKAPDTGLLLVGVFVGVAQNGKEHGWSRNRFRKIYRPKPNAFDQYLKAPDKQKEDA